MEGAHELPHNEISQAYTAAGKEGFQQTGNDDTVIITAAGSHAAAHTPQPYDSVPVPEAAAPPAPDYDYTDESGEPDDPTHVLRVKYLNAAFDDQGWPIGRLPGVIRDITDDQGRPVVVKSRSIHKRPEPQRGGYAIPDGRPEPDTTIHRDPVPRTLDEVVHDMVAKGVNRLLGARGRRTRLAPGRREHLGHPGHDVEGI